MADETAALTWVLHRLSSQGTRRQLIEYYNGCGDDPGATFLNIRPVDDHMWTSGDLLAVSLLSTQIVSHDVRSFLDPSASSTALNRLLSEEHLPVEADLRFTDDALFESMENLHVEVALALARAGLRRDDSRINAARMCARKRPGLFPAPENHVCQSLGLDPADYVDHWRTFRFLLDDDDVRHALDGLVDSITGVPDVRLEDRNIRLRYLDVALGLRERIVEQFRPGHTFKPDVVVHWESKSGQSSPMTPLELVEWITPTT